MRLLPFDPNTRAFENEKPDRRAWNSVFWHGVGRFGLVAKENWLAVILLIFSTLLFTQNGNQIVFLLPDQIGQYVFPHHDGHLGYPYNYWASFFWGILMVLWALIQLWDEIEGIANIGEHTRLPDVTFTMLALMAATYVLIECLFGKGKGADWASDFVITFVAAWALRMLLGLSHYRRDVLARLSMEQHRLSAEQSIKSWANWHNA